jgi:hypothetical protein
MLILLLLIVFLFLFFFPSAFEPKRSRDTKPKGTTDTQADESQGRKRKGNVELFLGLEDIEKDGHEEKRLGKAILHARNPILVLANIEG